MQGHLSCKLQLIFFLIFSLTWYQQKTLRIDSVSLKCWVLGDTDKWDPVSISRESNLNERNHDTNRNLNTVDGICLLKLLQTGVGQQQQKQETATSLAWLQLLLIYWVSDSTAICFRKIHDLIMHAGTLPEGIIMLFHKWPMQLPKSSKQQL